MKDFTINRMALDLSHQQKRWGVSGFGLTTTLARKFPNVRLIDEGILKQRKEVESCSVWVVALPMDSHFSSEEIDYIQAWVAAGGGLLVLGFYLADSHHERALAYTPRGLNINSLARMFGFEFANNLIMPPNRSSFQDCLNQAFDPGDVNLSVIIKVPGESDHPIVQGVRDVACLSACSLAFARQPEFVLQTPPSAIMNAIGEKDPQGRILQIKNWPGERLGEVPVLAAWQHGEGRVIASGTWKICTQAYGDNAVLTTNILRWLSQGKTTPPESPAERSPAMPATPSPTRTVELFYSYAHEDEKLREQLEKHLVILKRQGVIQDWHDRKIGAGTEWKGQIDAHLNSAGVILLLISADFLASDYCYDIELKRAMQRHEAGEARVIPVILRPVDWQGAPFGKLQALPKDAKPVTSWTKRDEAFANVAQGIRAAVEELVGHP